LNIKTSTIVHFFWLSCLLLPAAALSYELEPYKSEDSYNFSLPDLKGKAHTLNDYRGKVVLVNFWASWCTPCILEMPSMQRLANSLSDQAFEILTLNISDSPRRIQEVLKRLQVDLLVLLDHDGKTFKTWQGHVLPASYLFDASGQVRYRVVGPMEWDETDVRLKIKQLIQRQ
jgi:thiol-disulfide isomerase/thioredoxin